MANVQPPPITKRSPLWGLSFKVESIASRFTTLCQDIRDIWLIGQWLYYPFYWIAYYLTQAVTAIREADQWVAEHRAQLESLFNGSKFSELLNAVSSNLSWIRSDPLGWLRTQISYLSRDLIEIIVNARSWIRNRIKEIYPRLEEINNSPNSWIRSLVLQTFGLGAQLIIDPIGTLRHIITNISPFLGGLLSSGISYVIQEINTQNGWFRQFINNPTQTIRQFLTQINPDVNNLINNPKQWYKEKLATLLGISVLDTDTLSTTLGLIVIEKIKININQYRDRFKQAFCDIIMKFM